MKFGSQYCVVMTKPIVRAYIKVKEIILLRQHESNMGVSVGTGYRLKSSLEIFFPS